MVMFCQKSVFFPKKHPKFAKRLTYIWDLGSFLFAQLFPVMARAWLELRRERFFGPESLRQKVFPHPTAQCVLCKVNFSAQPNKLRSILKFEKYYPIEHIFVPACLSARKIHFFKF